MGPRLDGKQLRRRAIAGLRDEVEAFGRGHSESKLLRRDGLIAAVAPASPQRSLFNSVFYDDPAAPAREYEALAEAYEEAGVAAWTVWVPDEDRDNARLLAERGHLLDAAPRAMAMDLAELPEEPPAPAGVEPGSIEPAAAALLNDLAYGYGPDGFRAALAGETDLRWHGARIDGEPVCCVATVAVGDDCCVTGVATPAEHRGQGIASWLLLRALAEARREGLRSASLQATKAGAPIYERLGFADFGFIEMWELRK